MQCGAKTRNGTPCKAKPMANGRCRMHGGTQPKGTDSPNLKHGRYSRYMNASLQEKMAAVDDENPLDLLPELQVQRTLFADYISRFREGMALTAYDMDYMMGWSAEIGRMVERVVKMRNDTALTAAEIALIVSRIPEIVVKYIDDPDKQRCFVEDLFNATGANHAAGTRQSQRIAAENSR